VVLVKPETKKKIIITGIAIFISITAFSILTLPRVSINNPQKGELAPKESIQVRTGPLTSIKNIRVEQDGVPIDTYTNPEGSVTIRSYNYDSNYTVYAYVESTNPFLSIFGIGAKDIKTIRTWTTPKIVSIKNWKNQETTENIKTFKESVSFEVEFSKDMNRGKTVFSLNGEKVKGKWQDSRRTLLNISLVSGENFLTIEKGSLDTENKPLQNSRTIKITKIDENTPQTVIPDEPLVEKTKENEWKTLYNPEFVLDTGIIVPMGKKAVISASGVVNAGEGIVIEPNGGNPEGGAPAFYPLPGAPMNALLVKTTKKNWKTVGSLGSIPGDDSALSFVINDPAGPIPQGAGRSDNTGFWIITVTIQ
jgi:hypothetical protein